MRLRFLVLAGLGAVLAACDGGAEPTADPRLAGGTTTVFEATSFAYSLPIPSLSGADLKRHTDGDVAFEAQFVTAPAAVNAGLGPLFNRTSCLSCHARDGRAADVFLVRASSGQDPVTKAHLELPGFGFQIQDRALFGVQPEATVILDYVEEPGQFADGETYSLRRPTLRLENPYVPLPSGALLSPRTPRPVFGLGLLEAISEATIRDLAAQQAAQGEVSGKVNWVVDAATGLYRLGRFGWKAEQPSLRQQNAAAYRNDMGITSPLFGVESSWGYPAYDFLDDDPEITDATLDLVTFYVQTLAVPAARHVGSATVERGRTLFTEIGCATCHTPQLQTGTDHDLAILRNQTIFPYTDLLLHDMGDDLADHRPAFEADGREWRTPPLWGLGLSPVVNGHTQMLHDGRARNATEAILWHGGEAEASRDRFRALSRDERDALRAFLSSL